MSTRYAVQRKSLFMYPYGFTFNNDAGGMRRPPGWDWVNNLSINSEFLKEAVRIRPDD